MGGQLCLAGQCPIPVPAHPSPLGLAVCTSVSHLQQFQGKWAPRGAGANPASSRAGILGWCAGGAESSPQVTQSRNGCCTAVAGEQKVGGCEEPEFHPNIWNEGIPVDISTADTAAPSPPCCLIPCFLPLPAALVDFKLSHFCFRVCQTLLFRDLVLRTKPIPISQLLSLAPEVCFWIDPKSLWSCHSGLGAAEGERQGRSLWKLPSFV